MATVTFEQEPTTGGLTGNEVVPVAFPQGGGVYQTRNTTVMSISGFATATLLASANTWAQAQIFSGQSTFTLAPILSSLTGYLYGNGAGVAVTASTTIPMSAITGALPAAKLPTPTAGTLGGVESGTAPTHQWVTGISTGGALTYSQPAFSDLSGSVSFGSIGGQIAGSQVASSIITLGMMSNLTANSVIGNNTGSPAAPVALSAASVLDIIGTTTGGMLYRPAGGWSILTPPSTAAQILASTAANTFSWLAGPTVAGQNLTSTGANAFAWAVPINQFTLLATISTSTGTTYSQTSLPAYSEYFITFNNIVAGGTFTVKYSINNGVGYTATPALFAGGLGYGYCVLTATAADVCEFRSVTGAAATGTAGSFGAGNLSLGYFMPGGQINALQFVASGNYVGGTLKIYGR